MKQSKIMEGYGLIRTNLHSELSKIFAKSLPDQRHIIEMLYQNRMKIRELEENEQALAMLLSVEQARSIFLN